MNKEIISDKQGISLIVMFLVGTTTLSVFGLDAKESFWVSIILAIVMALPTAFIFVRFYHIFPDKDLFDIIEFCFGKFFGKAIIILFIYFLLEEGMFVLTNFGQFVNLTTLTDTPNIVITTSIIILCMWAIKAGIEIIGRWTEQLISYFIAFIIISILLSLPKMDINNVRPLFDVDFRLILKGAFMTFTFPFGEIVAFAFVFSGFQTKKSPSKIYFLGLLVGGILLILTSLNTILVLGVNIASIYYHPAYEAYMRIEIGDFLQRIEVLLALLHAFGAFIKISIYFFAVTKGIVKVFGFNNYRFMVVPIGLIIINLPYIYFDGVMDYWEYNNEIWPYYAFLFEMIFPIIIYIIAEIKNKVRMKQEGT